MKHPCMTLWPEKFLADTAGLTGEAAGVYLVLLMHAWVRGGSLPNAPSQLRLMARCHRNRWNLIWSQISPFWTLAEDGRLHQKRLDEEWERANRAHRGRNENIEKNPIRSALVSRSLEGSSNKKKHNETNGTSDFLARARDPTPTPTEKNSAPIGAESSSLAPASLRVLKAF